MTLQEVFDNFITSRKLADLSQSTITDYVNFLKPFLRAYGGENDFFELTNEAIDAYIQSLLNRDISKATRSTYIRNLRIFLHWAEREYPVKYDARKIKIPKTPKKAVRIYSDEDIKIIFDSIHHDIRWVEKRNRCIVALMYDSGLRQSEVCTLQKRHLYLSMNRMTVCGKGSKERTVPLGKTAKQYLQEYLAECPYDTEYVFMGHNGKPLTCNAVKLFISKLAKLLPFELSSHKLRHNFATNYCLDQYRTRNSVDIFRLMYLMGHEDIETTKRYLHFANEIIASEGCLSHLDNMLLQST